MKKKLLALCMIGASLSLSAQELLDFTQPDPVSATPARTTKLFRTTMNARMDFSAVKVAPEGGFEASPSLTMGFEIRPWRNRHYFGIGLTTEYVNSDLENAHYSFAGEVLSFNKVDQGMIVMDRLGWAIPLTYGFDLTQRKSLDFTVTTHYWAQLKLTNLYGSGPQSDYVQAQGLAQPGATANIGTYYKGYYPITVDFSVAYYPTANVGFGLKFSPPMLFKKGVGPSYTIFSWGFIARL